MFEQGMKLLIDLVLPGCKDADGVNRTMVTVNWVTGDDTADVSSAGIPAIKAVRKTAGGLCAIFMEHKTRIEVPVVAFQLV